MNHANRAGRKPVESRINDEKTDMKNYIIWDFDGTLGYREGLWTGALLEVLRQSAPDCAATAEHLRPHLQTGFPWHDPHQPYPARTAGQWWKDLAPVFERAFVAVGVTVPQAQHLAGEVRRVYIAPTHWRLFDDTLPALARLSEAGWTHLLLSNHVPELPSLLQHLQIDGFFARIFNSAETGYEKPHPQAFRRVLDAVGDAGTVWMIGDSAAADIAGAAAAGIPAILVRKRHSDTIYQCDDLSQVLSVLQTELSPKVRCGRG